MFERFTDRARKTMALANLEAQRFNHEYIGAEHIFLGLLMEGCGVGAIVLKALGVDLGALRKEVAGRLTTRPELISLGKLPQTPDAKKLVGLAIEESRTLNHGYVGTEHLIIALATEQQPPHDSQPGSRICRSRR